MKDYNETDARLQQIVQQEVCQLEQLHFSEAHTLFDQLFYSGFSWPSICLSPVSLLVFKLRLLTFTCLNVAQDVAAVCATVFPGPKQIDK